MKQKRLICIGGPTASGKTALAIELAKALQCEIISADSRQFYKGMAIGTAQPTEKELSKVKHHFIACNTPDDGISAGDFERMALKKCEELLSFNNVAICVGGSGLYLKALYDGFHKFPDVEPIIREQLINEFEKNGIEPLQKELQAKDPERYANIDTKNHQRLIRSLEIIRSSGKSYTSFIADNQTERPFGVLKFQCSINRDQLYERINQRVDSMYEKGLLKEVTELKKYWKENSLKTVGYQENIAYLKGEIDFEEAKSLLKQNTRNFAKRQITWFKKEGFKSVESIKEIIAEL